VKVIVLNACYSDTQAEILLGHVSCVIGMGGSISDEAARSFATSFYGGLGERASVAAAYNQGRAAISLEALSESDRPQLKVRNGVDPYQLILAADPSVSTTSTAGLSIIAMRTRSSSDFPIIDFTIRNNTPRSQVVMDLDIEVLEYHPIMATPTTRVLLPLAVYDVTVPRSIGASSLPIPTPVLVAPDDAATISIRLSCSDRDGRIPPNEAAFYVISFAFVSDMGIRAVSDPLTPEFDFSQIS
jgi:hypothetical protein